MHRAPARARCWTRIEHVFATELRKAALALRPRKRCDSTATASRRLPTDAKAPTHAKPPSHTSIPPPSDLSGHRHLAFCHIARKPQYRYPQRVYRALRPFPARIPSPAHSRVLSRADRSQRLASDGSPTPVHPSQEYRQTTRSRLDRRRRQRSYEASRHRADVGGRGHDLHEHQPSRGLSPVIKPAVQLGYQQPVQRDGGKFA